MGKINKHSTCHDCGVREGQIHSLGCDMERCPFCGGQLITCGCKYKLLGFDEYDENKPTCGLPRHIYEAGLPDDLWQKWEEILNKKGHVPYIRYPIICGYCGKLWPEMFMVPDEEWEKYIQINQRRSVLCRECFEDIKRKIDTTP